MCTCLGGWGEGRSVRKGGGRKRRREREVRKRIIKKVNEKV